MYSRFKDSIWAADLAEKGSLASFNCGVWLHRILNMMDTKED